MLKRKCLCVIVLAGLVLADFKCSDLCASGTCCKGDAGKILCCPASDGVCCASGKTCCPPGTTCNTDGHCSKIESGFFGLINFFTPATPQKQVQTEAPGTGSRVSKSCASLCGVLCCAYENGVCCEDGEHCCPAGYKCDSATRSCRLSLQSIASKTEKGDRNCPLSESDCSTTDTCCVLRDGSKGCCPYKNADCCADGAHCCPEGTVCNADSSGCEPRSGAWVDPFKPSPKLFGRKSVVCPGGKAACNKGSTCCKSAAGEDSSYSCCPYENAVCCGDGEHCCPEGYTCDPVNGGSCVRSSSSEVLKPSYDILKSPEKFFGGNKCNDGQTICPDEATCCALGDGSFACCPLPDAVCCEDHEHCCPDGYMCHVANNRCIQKTDLSKFTPIFKKFAPAPISKGEEVSEN